MQSSAIRLQQQDTNAAVVRQLLRIRHPAAAFVEPIFDEVRVNNHVCMWADRMQMAAYKTTVVVAAVSVR